MQKSRLILHPPSCTLFSALPVPPTREEGVSIDVRGKATMCRRPLLILSLLTTLLFGGQTPAPIQREGLQRELEALAKRGYTYRVLDNDLIELSDPVSGAKQLKSLREPTEAQIRPWATQRGIPILEIDPNTIDTSKYRGWYTYWTTVPLGNSFGIPLVVGDVNHNGQTDMYGVYKDTLSFDYEAKLYEVDTLGNVLLRYQYIPRPGVSRQFADVDRDSNVEIAWSYAGIVSGYEQHSRDSLPLYRTFAHDRHYHSWDPGYTGIYIGNLDGDNLTDFLYQGTGPDPNDTNIAISKTYVAEYDPSLQNFVRVWSTQFYPGSGAAGFAVGDFDGDGKMDFVATHSTGEVYVAENTADNEYTLIWQDSTPFVNFYYQGSGDVDNDGRIEFFTGATMSNGNWVLMYESDSNNAYSAKFLFHLLSGGVFAEPIYITVDLDVDGKLELAMMVGSDLYVFKSNTDNEYYLWYFRRESRMEAIAFYDFNRDGRMDFSSSKREVNSQGNVRLYVDIYTGSPLVEVHEQHNSVPPDQPRLYPGYPNPFNPSTTICFSLPSRQHVVISIHDLRGRQVAILLDRNMESGTHTVEWKPTVVSSGIYFCRLETRDHVLSTKLLLLK
jgi:hypothetical protein